MELTSRSLHRTIRARFNYIVDYRIPPVCYIDWPEMEHKAFRRSTASTR